MGMLRTVAALLCIFGGVALTVTVIGAIVGLPLMGVGIYLAYKERREHIKTAIREGIVEAERIKKKEE